jgi:SP family arabinose:H+ symporter-like MFS transporter
MLVTRTASDDGSARSIIPLPRVTRVVLRSAVVAALGGLLFGFDTAVIAGTTRALSQVFSLTPQTLGVTVSSALWGTILGTVYAGYGADRWGRRDSLRVMAALYLVSAIGCGLAWSWPALLFFRILGGVGIGGSSVFGPMYIAEISPTAWRGRLVGVFQFSLVVGILAAYLSNYVISLQGLGTNEWRWQLGVAAVPSLVFFLLLFSIPRSPRWLVKAGRLAEARLVLVKIGEPDVERELSDIARSLVVEDAHGSKNDMLFSRAHRFPIFLAVSIAAFSQFSGINAVLYYLNDIFGAAGFTRTSAGMQAVVIGVTNLLFTVFAVLLIDRVGRKILLLIGSVGMAVTLCGISFIFATQRHRSLLLGLLIVYIGSFAFSLGAVTWVYISEVFPNAIRAKGQSLGTFTHWVVNAVIAGVFPAMAARSGAAPFVFFAFMMALLFFVVLILYPETKNVSLESVDSLLPVSLEEN